MLACGDLAITRHSFVSSVVVDARKLEVRFRRIFPQKTGFEATGKPRLMRAWAGLRPGKSSHVISEIFILLIVEDDV
jgi:hypothetical protein